jgi:hypothetical protein
MGWEETQGSIGRAARRAREYLATPAGRRMQRTVATAFIIGSPLIFRLPGLRKHWAVRTLELTGGAVLLVKLGEWLRDYDPGVDGAEWSRP